METQPIEMNKKKKAGIMSPNTERMGLTNDTTALQSPPRIQAMAQGQPLGMMMQQNMPNMSEIALSQRTNSTNLGLGQEAGGLDSMERVKDGVARRAGKEKSSIFGM